MAREERTAISAEQCTASALHQTVRSWQELDDIFLKACMHLAGGGAADDQGVAPRDVRRVVHRQLGIRRPHHRRRESPRAAAVGAERCLAQRIEQPVAEPARSHGNQANEHEDHACIL